MFLTPRMLLPSLGPSQHLPPSAWPKIAAFQQVLWFLMACFSRTGRVESPSPALCKALCRAGAGTFITPPHPGKGLWFCLYQLCGWFMVKQHFMLPGIVTFLLWL